MQEPSIIAETIEMPVSELQGFYDDLVQVYNGLNEVLQEAGIVRGRELAEMNTTLLAFEIMALKSITKLFLWVYGMAEKNRGEAC